MRIDLEGIPKSINQFIGRDCRWQYISEKAKWTNAVYYLALSNQERPVEPYQKATITITYYFKDKRRHDPDNYCGKFLMDGLTKAGVIKDDNFDVVTLCLQGNYDKGNPHTVIEVVGV